jgi:hypothetical protein
MVSVSLLGFPALDFDVHLFSQWDVGGSLRTSRGMSERETVFEEFVP